MKREPTPIVGRASHAPRTPQQLEELAEAWAAIILAEIKAGRFGDFPAATSGKEADQPHFYEEQTR